MSSMENGAEVPAPAARAPKTPERAHPVTLRDVAEAAGVSTATVSLVVNKKKAARIAEETRRRVQDAIRTLGYRPNAMAKTLVSGTSRFIGLVADGVATTPFAGQIIHGAQDEAWKHGYALLIANTEGNGELEQDAIQMMLEYKVRGILYSTWFHRQTDIPAPLREAGFVLVNCFSNEPGTRAVVPDEVQGGRSATEILLGHGHRKIAFINATIPAPAKDGRLQGYREALEKAGVPFDPELVLEAYPDQEGGYGATSDLLTRGVTAVFCYNDLMALGRPRSSLCRCGVTLHTAVWDAGYRGRSTSLLNVMNPSGFRVQRGARLLQLVFFGLASETAVTHTAYRQVAEPPSPGARCRKVHQ